MNKSVGITVENISTDHATVVTDKILEIIDAQGLTAAFTADKVNTETDNVNLRARVHDVPIELVSRIQLAIWLIANNARFSVTDQRREG